MMNRNHQISKALLLHYGPGILFVLEDLTGIRVAMETVRLKARYETVSWSFYQLIQMIEYKATIACSKAIAVDPKYTSQRCPKCDHTKEGEP